MLSILVPSVHFLNFSSWAFTLFSYYVGLNTPSLAVCYCQIQYQHHTLLNHSFKRITRTLQEKTIGSTYVLKYFLSNLRKKYTLGNDRYVAIAFLLRSLRNLSDIQTLHDNICVISLTHPITLLSHKDPKINVH